MADPQRPGLIVGLVFGLAVAFGGALLSLPSVALMAGRPGPLPSIALVAAIVIAGLVLGAAVVAFLPPFVASRDQRRASATMPGL